MALFLLVVALIGMFGILQLPRGGLRPVAGVNPPQQQAVQPASGAGNVATAGAQTAGISGEGYLGLDIQAVTEETRQRLGLTQGAGVLVAGTREGGPARTAGIVAGDVLLSIDRRDVSNVNEAAALARKLQPGRVIEVVTLRNGEQEKRSVRVENLEVARLAEAKVRVPAASPEILKSALGIAVATLSLDLRQRHAIPLDRIGAVITDIEPGSPSDRGLAVGMVIVSIDNEAVAIAEHVHNLVAHLKQSGKRSALLLVAVSTSQHFVSVPLR